MAIYVNEIYHPFLRVPGVGQVMFVQLSAESGRSHEPSSLVAQLWQVPLQRLCRWHRHCLGSGLLRTTQGSYKNMLTCFGNINKPPGTAQVGGTTAI